MLGYPWISSKKYFSYIGKAVWSARAKIYVYNNRASLYKYISTVLLTFQYILDILIYAYSHKQLN